MMEKITVCKANPLPGEIVPDMILEISRALPEVNDLGELRDFYQDQAADIMSALRCLCQGVKHELLIQMLEEKMCLFTIPSEKRCIEREVK